MDTNAQWHAKHQLPAKPTMDQRVKWHIEHARRCTCRHPIDPELLDELKRRYLGTHQDFWILFNRGDHQALALWAAECAEHLLPYFEGNHPEDPRPRDAIQALREWVATGKFSMAVIRRASLAAHAAARAVKQEDNLAAFAAHAAGQAVATAHVPTHALGPVLYAVKLVTAAHPAQVTDAIAAEREWQSQRLPDNLRWWVDAWLNRTQQHHRARKSESGVRKRPPG